MEACRKRASKIPSSTTKQKCRLQPRKYHIVEKRAGIMASPQKIIYNMLYSAPPTYSFILHAASLSAELEIVVIFERAD